MTQAYSVSGATDALLMLRLKDMDELDALTERLFGEGSNVARYYTSFVIRTGKETTAIPLLSFDVTGRASQALHPDLRHQTKAPGRSTPARNNGVAAMVI